MIKVEGLTKEFIRKGRDGKAVRKLAVDGLSFEIGRGEIFGLLGPNGAGKTTTIRMLTMQTEKSAGRIFYDGMPLEGNEKAIKEMIGIVPQHIKLQKVVLHTVIFKMCRDNITVSSICRMLNGTKILHIHIIRNDYQATGMLTGCTFHADTSKR